MKLNTILTKLDDNLYKLVEIIESELNVQNSGIILKAKLERSYRNEVLFSVESENIINLPIFGAFDKKFFKSICISLTGQEFDNHIWFNCDVCYNHFGGGWNGRSFLFRSIDFNLLKKEFKVYKIEE